MDKHMINILIVDDEVPFLEAMTKRLAARGFNVIAVDRGEKAIEAAQNHPVDIALLDLKMPGLDGAQTLQALKQAHEWMEIVILTGHGSIESAVDLAKSGAYSYLQKPCDWGQLFEVLVEAYKKKIMNKMEIDEQRMQKILDTAADGSPRAILDRIRQLDREG